MSRRTSKRNRRRKPKNGKQYAQRKHAKRRLKDRYDLEINREQYQEIIGLIQSGQSECVEVQSLTRTLHVVNYQDTDILVVYDKKRNELCTALPERALNRYAAD